MILENKTYNKTITFFSITLIGVFIILVLLFLMGLRFNSTESYPIGFYWANHESPKKGDLVTFCPPDKEVFREAKKRGYITYGFCEGDYGEMIKRILAAKGDSITVTENGVFVNDVMIKNSKPFIQDGVKREMPAFRVNDYVLAENEVLLLSDFNSGSFDARYFGLVNKNKIQRVVTPLLTK